ncbi:MAG: hypothetical protein AAGG44_06225 [Planctomycetota bacterium]
MKPRSSPTPVDLQGVDFWESGKKPKRLWSSTSRPPLLLIGVSLAAAALLISTLAGVWWAVNNSESLAILAVGEPSTSEPKKDYPSTAPFEREAFLALLDQLSDPTEASPIATESVRELHAGLKLGFFRFTPEERLNLLKAGRVIVLDLLEHSNSTPATQQAAWELAKTLHRYRCQWPDQQTEFERRLVEASQRLDQSANLSEDIRIIESLQRDMQSMLSSQLAKSDGVPYRQVGHLQYYATQFRILAEAAAAGPSMSLANEMMYVSEKAEELGRELRAKHTIAIRGRGSVSSNPSPALRGGYVRGGSPSRRQGFSSNPRHFDGAEAPRGKGSVWGLRVEAYFLDREEVIFYIETQLAEYDARVVRVQSGVSSSWIGINGIKLDFKPPDYNAPFLVVCTCPGGNQALTSALPRARVRSIDHGEQEVRLVIDEL